jgi:hypothetical protein
MVVAVDRELLAKVKLLLNGRCVISKYNPTEVLKTVVIILGALVDISAPSADDREILVGATPDKY